MMAPKLPDGLIQSGMPYLPGSEDTASIPLDDIIRLWRAHFVIKYAQSGNTSFRLEYFFWRIMGSPRLRRSLTEAQIARFHAAISQDNPIRTTPRQSPIRLRDNNDVPDPNHGDPDVLLGGRRFGSVGARTLDPSTAKARMNRDRSTSRPRPILRTPGIDTITPGKSARILTPTWGGDAKVKKSLGEEMFNARDASLNLHSSILTELETATSILDTSNLSSARSVLSSKGTPVGSPSKGARKGSFAVGSKRRRPAMPNRRSSQSTTSLSNRSPRQSPVVNQGSFDPVQSVSDIHSGLQQIDETSSRNEASETSSLSSGLRTGINLNRSEGDLKLAAAKLPIGFNPQMRAMSTKASLSTGVSLVSPITASLQPFAEQASSTVLPVRTTLATQNLDVRGSQSGHDTLQRSRDNLNLLLERDRRKASGSKKGKKS